MLVISINSSNSNSSDDRSFVDQIWSFGHAGAPLPYVSVRVLVLNIPFFVIDHSIVLFDVKGCYVLYAIPKTCTVVVRGVACSPSSGQELTFCCRGHARRGDAVLKYVHGTSAPNVCV